MAIFLAFLDRSNVVVVPFLDLLFLRSFPNPEKKTTGSVLVAKDVHNLCKTAVTVSRTIKRYAEYQ